MLQPTALMAEASSDNTAARASEFLCYSVYPVFKASYPHGTRLGWAPSTSSSTELVNSVKQLKVLQHLTCRVLTKITVWPYFARDPPVWLGGCVHLRAPLLRQCRVWILGVVPLALLVRGRSRSHLSPFISKSKHSPWFLGTFRHF